MGPQKQRITVFDQQMACCPHRQTDFGGDMTKGQIGQHGDAKLRTQPTDHAVQLEALVMRGQLVVCELAQHDGLLLRQYPCMQPLREHALNAVGMLGNVLQEKHALLDGRQIGRTQQAGEHREVPPPQNRIARPDTRFAICIGLLRLS